jgi:diadenosine tetraphosphate (Ap4A) HIT family hydrolase
MSESECVFCDQKRLRDADMVIENEHCVDATTRDPCDPPDVLPGSGVIVPIAHRASPFDFTDEEWTATHELLLEAKAAQDERLAPDGYSLFWSPFPHADEHVHSMHAHLHVVPRFDDEPNAHLGGRTHIKGRENIRPHPSQPGTGRAKLFGRSRDPQSEVS